MTDQFVALPLERVAWKTPIRGEEITRKDVENLSTSLMVHGQIHPIVVTPPDEEGMYEGVCGRLRFLGAKHRGMPTILARVHRFESEEEKVEWQLAENLHRRDIPPISKSDGYAKLEGLVAKRLERETGKKPSEKAVREAIAEEQEKLTGEKRAEETVRKYLEVARKLKSDTKKVVVDYQLGFMHCLHLLRVEDPEIQLWLAEEAGKRELTEKKLKQVIKNLERATETVKRAVLSREIALGHLAHLANLYQHQQEKVLDSVKRNDFAPKTTKLLVDLVLEKPEEIDRLTSLTAFELEAEKEKARVAKTPEELMEAWKMEEAEKFQPLHTYKCPGCGRELTIKIDWFNGVVEWES